MLPSAGHADFVGRELELAALLERLEAAGRGWGSVALIAVNRADVARNTFARAYQLVDLASGKMTAVPERLQNPRWSASGTTIAWLQRGAPRSASWC